MRKEIRDAGSPSHGPFCPFPLLDVLTIWPACSYCKNSLHISYCICDCRRGFEHGMQMYVGCMDAYAITSPQTSWRSTVTLQNVSVDIDSGCCSWKIPPAELVTPIACSLLTSHLYHVGASSIYDLFFSWKVFNECKLIAKLL